MADPSHTCHIGACQRHRRCMYVPCRAAGAQDATELRNIVVTSACREGKTHAMRIARVRAVAKGATINGTYRMEPGPALEAFRADLLAIVGEK